MLKIISIDLSKGELTMTNLEELIQMTRRLSERLANAANEEKRFCVDIQLRLEQMSWEIIRTADQLNAIQQFIA
jgi:hypothetical protein